jgi:hypothetical protein
MPGECPGLYLDQTLYIQQFIGSTINSLLYTGDVSLKLIEPCITIVVVLKYGLPTSGAVTATLDYFYIY